MTRTRDFAVCLVFACSNFWAFQFIFAAESPVSTLAVPDHSIVTDEAPAAVTLEPLESRYENPIEQSNYLESLSKPHAHSTAAKKDSAKFPKAYQIPGTETWWKFGGYVKGDLIHDFQPAGTVDRFVPITIPTDGQEGQNTLLQAKATRLNLDVRTLSDWGIVRGFVETDFFTSDNTLRIRHAYAEVGTLLAGQTWSVFTDPDSIPRTLDFESPIAFLTTRQGQLRWTLPIDEKLKWALSIENPTTVVDDIVTTTIPGEPQQPTPDLATHLKYKGERVELFAAGLFRELTYRPDFAPAQNHFGWATNLVGILRPTDADKLMAQFVFGRGLGRYRSGSDLGLANLTTTEVIEHVGGSFSLTHDWTKKLSSTAVYSFAKRDDVAIESPDTPNFASYTAVNLIWEPVERTTFGIEYLYGTNETKDDAFGSANRIQISVQYNFP